MDYATERGHAEVVRLLQGGGEAGASEAAVDPDALWRAADKGDEAEVSRLIALGAPLEHRDKVRPVAAGTAGGGRGGARGVPGAAPGGARGEGRRRGVRGAGRGWRGRRAAERPLCPPRRARVRRAARP